MKFKCLVDWTGLALQQCDGIVIDDLPAQDPLVVGDSVGGIADSSLLGSQANVHFAIVVGHHGRGRST